MLFPDKAGPNQTNPPLNDDDRELGLNVYNVFVVDADEVGEVEGVVDAEPLGPSAPVKP